MLRVSYILEAQPGVYPILKSTETPQNCPGNSRCTDYVLIPYQPFTVVAYNVRKLLLLELVETGQGGAGAAPARPQVPQESPVSDLDGLRRMLVQDFGDEGRTVSDALVGATLNSDENGKVTLQLTVSDDIPAEELPGLRTELNTTLLNRSNAGRTTTVEGTTISGMNLVAIRAE